MVLDCYPVHIDYHKIDLFNAHGHIEHAGSYLIRILLRDSGKIAF